MRYSSIAFGLLFTAAFAQAQSAGWQPPVPDAAKVNLSPVMAARLSYLTGACPVGLQAQRKGSTSMVVVDGKLRRQTGPTVRLTVNNLQGKDIVGATVRVLGYSARPQLFLVQPVSSAAEMTKTVALKLDAAKGKNGEADVTAEKFGSISRIYLESLQYADGTEWSSNKEQSCYVEPDRLVLVADR